MEKGDEKKKLETQKMYQPTRDEYAALHYLAIALRPEWKNGLGPGKTWEREIIDRTFDHAESFEHCVRALKDYCHAEKQGEKKYKYPTLFPGAKEIWESARPLASRVKRAPCASHPENDGGEANCSQCWADIKAGQRPIEYLGKKYANTDNAA